jgi:hypothetical protein
MKREPHRGKKRAAYNDKYTNAIDAGADDIHDPPKGFHGCPYCRKARRFSILRVNSRKELQLLIAAHLWQIDWAGGTNILVAVNCQRCDRGVRN